MNEKMKELFSDEAFVKTLLEAENVEAVQKMLADKGVEMTTGEIEIMGELLEQGAKGNLNMEALDRLANGGELTEEDLEQAAGGNWFTNLFCNVTTAPARESLSSVGSSAADTIVKYTVSAPKVAGGIAAGVLAVAGIGYGIYDAVRRRW